MYGIGLVVVQFVHSSSVSVVGLPSASAPFCLGGLVAIAAAAFLTLRFVGFGTPQQLGQMRQTVRADPLARA